MKKRLILAISVAMLVLLFFLFWPVSRYDLAQVHPRIQALQRPYQRVTTEYYLDGGSVGIEIIDRDGHKLDLAIPIYDGPGDKRTYHRLYIGARTPSHTNAVELEFTDDTKRFLADVIGHYATGPDRDCAVLALRGSPRDYLDVYGRGLFRKVTGRDKKVGYTISPR